MSTNQERSFIAALTTNYGNLHIPRITYGKKTTFKRWYYEAFTFESFVDISSYLCVKAGAPADQLLFHFKCIDDYYSIYLLTNDQYHHYALSNENRSCISAFPHDDDQTTYNLLDSNGNIVTLDQLEGNKHTLKIQTRGGRKLHTMLNTPAGGIVCTGQEGGAVLNFEFNIAKRGVS